MDGMEGNRCVYSGEVKNLRPGTGWQKVGRTNMAQISNHMLQP